MDIADSIGFVPEPTMQVELASRKRSRTAATNSDEEDPDHVQTSGRGRRKAHDSDRQPSSKFKGVCWSKTNKRWQAAIFVHSRNLYLGCYNEELDAAKAYDWVAIKTRGADAKINFPASDYQGADGNMVPNERLNSMVARHQQNIDSAKKTQLPAISSQSALRTPVTAGQQQQRQHKSTAMAAPSRLQSDTWDLAEQQEIDMSLLCGRSASEFMGSGVSEEQQVFAGVLPQAAVAGAIGQCSQQQRPPNQMGKLGQQLVLEELQSRMLSEHLSHQLTDKLFEQPDDAEYLLSQILLDRATPALSAVQQPQQQQRQLVPPPVDVLEQLKQQLQPSPNTSPPQAASSAGFMQTEWRQAPARMAAAAAAAAANNGREGAAGQLRNTYWPHRHHIDMSDMASKLPLGAFLQQIVTGPYGMYGLVFGCPQDRTWGAGVWDGMDWHSIGSYGNEADALRACCFVVDVGTSSCPSEGSEADFEEDCVC